MPAGLPYAPHDDAPTWKIWRASPAKSTSTGTQRRARARRRRRGPGAATKKSSSTGSSPAPGDEHVAAGARPGQQRLGDPRRQHRRDRGVDGVAAGAQDVGAGLRGQRVAGGHDARVRRRSRRDEAKASSRPGSPPRILCGAMASADTIRRTALATLALAARGAARGLRRRRPERDAAGTITKAGKAGLLKLRAGDCMTDLRERLDEPRRRRQRRAEGHGRQLRRAARRGDPHDRDARRARSGRVRDRRRRGARAVARSCEPRLVTAAGRGPGERLTFVAFRPTQERWDFENQHAIVYLVLYAKPQRGAGAEVGRAGGEVLRGARARRTRAATSSCASTRSAADAARHVLRTSSSVTRRPPSAPGPARAPLRVCTADPASGRAARRGRP